MNNSKHPSSPEVLRSVDREGIKLRTTAIDGATSGVAHAFYALAPEEFMPAQPVPPSREVQEYAARMAATQSAPIAPDVLAAERQAVDDALNAGSY